MVYEHSTFKAHGMLPHLGAGAGQGFEDVYTLCRLLAHPGTNKSSLDVGILGLHSFEFCTTKSI